MGWTILVVEVDAALGELLCALLEEDGYAGIGVEDGQRALEVLATGARGPDAVVLDMGLPRLNGHEVLQELCLLQMDGPQRKKKGLLGRLRG